MTCNNCIHYELCEVQAFNGFNKNWDPEKDWKHCGVFKDKSKYIELPCKVGDTVYIKGVPLVVSFVCIDDEANFVIQFDCEDCYKCPFYEDEVSFEGEHDCRTQGHLEFTESDIGKTVFLTKSEAEQKLKEMKENA